jgi:trimeric autotransporter adhesin
MPQQEYLYAATWGRGIYRIRLVNNDPVAGLLFTPAQVRGGSPITGTVYLGTPAPAGGKVVTLSSSNPTVGSVPASITVPQGQNFGNFTITTTTVGFPTPVDITASVSPVAPGSSKTGRITVLSGQSAPVLTSFVFDLFGTELTFGIGGSYTADVTVTLSKAVTAPVTVTITSSSSGATVPSSVVIPTGQSMAKFQIQLNPVAAPETTSITARLGGIFRTIKATRN